jgi:molecular chaperone IbpA
MKQNSNYPEPWDSHKNPYDPYDKLKWQKHKVEVPKVVTINDLFPRLDRLSIGWSPLLEQLKEVTQNKPSYPPYDIVALKDDKEDVTLLNVAVAGFSKNEISVTVQDSVVTIEGEKEEKQEGEIVYQGIATRNFKLSLAIAEYWEVTHANLENGMLTVQFNKNLPEEKKPKVIPVK